MHVQAESALPNKASWPSEKFESTEIVGHVDVSNKKKMPADDKTT
jgi:hypothetical protein